jgi:phosphoglycerate dehydrogenase-like enzyme
MTTEAAPHRIVACLPGESERAHMGALPANVGIVLVHEEPEPLPDLASVDFVIPTIRLRPALLELLASEPGRLRVIQTLSAGVDWLIGHVPEQVTVCNARGAFDGPLAEWVLGAILTMQRGLTQARDQQAKREWSMFEPAELAGARVVILGIGSIGSAIAARLAPFGVEMVGIGRSAREGVHALAELDGILPSADILVNMLPLTSETRGLLDGPRLGLLPDGALVVNGGRGKTIAAEALIRELSSGRLRAVLDVTDPEPLPVDHPLWSLPNVLVSPHIAGDSPAATVRTYAIAGDQLRRYAAGEPLRNVVPRYQLE